MQSCCIRLRLHGAAWLALGMMSVIPARAVDPTWNYAVQITASVSSLPPQITLTWAPDTSTTPLSCAVYRKSPAATTWTPLATLDGLATTYTDATVAVGTAYEYQIIRPTSTYTAYGYISTAIALPPIDSRGTVILVVDSTYAATLSAELTRLQQDLAGDGWTVLRHDVNRTDSATGVKALIAADYYSDPTKVQAVFLFGHVPVPYSGQLAPDGHADHVGAWPADVYYGDIDGNWTDFSINFVQSLNSDPADAARLTNLPNDRKFDATWIPSAVELEVGRVDFANLPGRVNGVATFAPEPDLLRQYLNKDHAFRQKITAVSRRAVVADYFGIMSGEVFAAGGYRNFTPLVGRDQLTNLNALYNDAAGVWEPTLSANDYLLAYGCGPGTYPGIGGIGSTPDLVAADVRGVFNFVCGSWFGDWDHEDNVMRAILATKDNGLTAVWSGRPHWFIHPMGTGETIGYCARLVQNNQTRLYRNQINSAAGAVHIALMGDPTLRLLPVAPATQLSGAFTSPNCSLAWLPSTDTVVGYHVYRANSAAGPFTRLTPTPISATSFQDSGASYNTTYMVRAVKLELTSSGSYYNASQGIFWSTPADTIPPTVAITAPGNASTVVGTATVSASATDNSGVAGVSFFVDGVPLGGEMTAPPYGVTWATNALVNGLHTVKAVARDVAGNTAAATITVNVNNPDITPPTVSVLAPVSGSAIQGLIAITAAATDNIGVVGVQFKVDGANCGAETTAAPYAFTWDSTLVRNGAHTIQAVARDATGNQSTAMISVTVSNPDITPPTITLLLASNSVVLGSVGLTASASDDVGVVGVQFAVDGVALGSEIAVAPYSATWDSTPLPNGAHTVTATARDAAGNKATATATVIVNNPDLTPPSITLTAPATNTVLVGQVAVAATATDNIGVVGVQFLLDGVKLGNEVLAPPYTVSWDTTTATNAPHVLTAIARDAAGNKTTSAAASVTVSNVPPLLISGEGLGGKSQVGSLNLSSSTLPPAAYTVWFDDALPPGASVTSADGDTWQWISGSPKPFAGLLAHQSALADGLHEHGFSASSGMTVGVGETLFATVYLDPANPPSEIMLSWKAADGWEHRAYWGINKIAYGQPGTASRRFEGRIPAAGQWVVLAIPAADLGLEGKTVTGMLFSLYDGKAAWDLVGKFPGK